eukprot:scaffold78987_cov24-Tisochrysis_lutea.AAC.1
MMDITMPTLHHHVLQGKGREGLHSCTCLQGQLMCSKSPHTMQLFKQGYCSLYFCPLDSVGACALLPSLYCHLSTTRMGQLLCVAHPLIHTRSLQAFQPTTHTMY